MSGATTLPGLGTAQATTRRLAEFLAAVRHADLSPEVLLRTTELFLDWVGCCVAGSRGQPVLTLARFAATMGSGGRCDVIPGARKGSAYQAAFANAASSHFVEQDDLHNASVVHPATVVFPAALAAAQDLGKSGRELLTASVVGYEAATRVGSYLGPSHYRYFHTTGTAGTLGAAAAVAHLLGADAGEMTSALGNAGTTAAGLWQFLRDSADSKPLHTAHAAATGLAAAYMAHDGLEGAARIIEGERGMGEAMSRGVVPEALVTGLGETWAVMHTSLKVHASCRHTHPAADALEGLLADNGIVAADIDNIEVGVYQAAQDVLEAAQVPTNTHQAKFSMGFVLSLVASRGRAGVLDFDASSIKDPELLDLASRVVMRVDPEIQRLHPQRWAAEVKVRTRGGAELVNRVESPKGDPDMWLTPGEIDDKFRNLAAYGGQLDADEIKDLIRGIRDVGNREDVTGLLSWRHGT